MLDLIRTDPTNALDHAVTYRLRKGLPSQVVALLEELVSGKGRYDVMAVDHVTDQGLRGETRRSFTTLDGRTLSVSTYGRRSHTPTKNSLSGHGIALDGFMAMHESPVRELDSAERADLDLPADGVALAAYDRFIVVEDREAMARIASEIEAVEDKVNPFSKEPASLVADTVKMRRVSGTEPPTAQSPLDDGGSSSAGGLAPESSWTEGAKTLLYIRARFADESPTYEPLTLAAAQTYQEAVNQYYQNASYGKTSIESTFTTTVTLPHELAYYSTNWMGFSLLLSDACAAAKAANPSWDWANFNLYTVATAHSGFTYAGSAWVGGAGCHLAGYFSLRTAGHEYGHNFGLGHANYWRTDSPSPIGRDSVPGGYVGDTVNSELVEYGHRFSLMSAMMNADLDNAEKPHFAPYEKLGLGWLSTADVATVSASGTYRVYRHDHRDASSGTRAIKVNVPFSDYWASGYNRKYWLSYRRNLFSVGTSKTWMPYGLQVDLGKDAYSMGISTVLLDMTPFSDDDNSGASYNDDNADKDDGFLLLGRTYSDGKANIHITPIAGGGSSPSEWVDVVVTLGAVPDNHPPQLVLTAGTNQAAINQPVTFTASAVDPDGDPLAYGWYYTDNTSTGSTNLNSATAVRSWGAVGEYRVMCVASDMKGGIASDTIVMKVGNPAAHYRITGRVLHGGRPVAGARVNIGSSYQTWSDSDGSYVLPGLAIGSHTVTCRKDGLTFAAQFTNPVGVGPYDAYGKEFWANEPYSGIGTAITVHPYETEVYEGSNLQYVARGWDSLGTGVSVAAAWNVSGGGTIDGSGVFSATTAGGPFVVTATDQGASGNAYVWVVPYVSNTLPVAADDAYVAWEDTVLTVAAPGVLDNDTDADGDPLTAAMTTNPAHGALTLGSDGSFAYTPSANWSGLDSFTYRAGDTRSGLSSNAIVWLDVGAINDAPTVSLTSPINNTGFNAYADITVSATATDVDGTVSIVEFYAGTSGKIGEMDSAPYSMVWGSVPPGVYALTAVASDMDGALKTSTVVTVTVTNGATPVVGVTPQDSAAAEPNAASGAGNGVFRISRTGGNSSALTVYYAMSGSAANGVDYALLTGAVVIAAGSAYKDVSVVPLADAEDEDGESVIMTVLADAGYDADNGRLSAALALQDADYGLPEVRALAQDAEASEPNGAAGKGTGSFRIYRTGSLHANLLVPYQMGGSALNGLDYSPLSGMATVIVNNAYVTLTVTARTDAEDEPDEGVVLAINADAAYTVNPTNADAAVVMYDAEYGTPTVWVIAQDKMASEPGALTNSGTGAFWIYRTGSTHTNLAVRYEMSGAAVNGADYSVVTGAVSIGAAGTYAAVTITALNDKLVEADEEAILTLVPMTNYVVGATNSGAVTIVDNGSNAPPEMPVATIAATDGSAGEPSNRGTFTITLAPAPTGAVTVSLAMIGTAQKPADYTTTVSSVVIPAGVPTGAVHVVVKDDLIYEGDETVQMIVVPGNGYVQGDPLSAILTIVDDETNISPAAGDDYYTVVALTNILNVAAPGVLQNDFDPDTNAMTAVTVTDPAGGTLTLHEDGSFQLAWSNGWYGVESFTYKVRDSNGGESSNAMVTIDAKRDSDSDGTPDDWEILYGLNPAVSNATADTDTDSDGMCDLFEFIAGTVPTDSNSVFMVERMVQPGGPPLVLTWQSLADRMYSVEAATNMNPRGWIRDPVFTDRIGSGGQLSFTNSPPGTNRFYRLSVRLRY